jgi:hypothetical protein
MLLGVKEGLQHLAPLILCSTLLTGAWQHLAPMILYRDRHHFSVGTWVMGI